MWRDHASAARRYARYILVRKLGLFCGKRLQGQRLDGPSLPLGERADHGGVAPSSATASQSFAFGRHTSPLIAPAWGRIVSGA
jgi:hypothetical protein